MDYKWHHIDFSSCPSWLKHEVHRYQSKHGTKNQSVLFKGRHFRYIVHFGSGNEGFSVKRRLRYRVKIDNQKKNKNKGDANKMTSRKKSTSYTKQQGMTQQEYLDFCGVKTADGLQVITKKLLWQTKGKNGDRPPYWVKLVDCDNNHLKKILIHVKYVHSITKEVILSILESRWSEEHQGILDKIKRWEQQGYSMDTIDKIIHHTKINESHSDSNKREPIVINFTDKSIKIDNENGVMNRSPIGKNTTDEYD